MPKEKLITKGMKVKLVAANLNCEAWVGDIYGYEIGKHKSSFHLYNDKELTGKPIEHPIRKNHYLFTRDDIIF